MGDKPLAILSLTTTTVQGTIDLRPQFASPADPNANSTVPGAGGGEGGRRLSDPDFFIAETGRPAAGAPAGAGGGAQGSEGGGGGGFGGAGGHGSLPTPAPGGVSYGNMVGGFIQGGSGGGGAGTFGLGQNPQGGDGGGGIELGALGNILIDSSAAILVDGGEGELRAGNDAGGGGGAGGGILIHGLDVTIHGKLSANGGNGGPHVQSGGGGGGGRIVVAEDIAGSTSLPTIALTGTNTITAHAGFGGSGSVDGSEVLPVLDLSFASTAVPESYSYTINWGDGSSVGPIAITASDPIDGEASAIFSGVHTYGDNGVYSVTVTVSDGQVDGDSDPLLFDITVANLAPIVSRDISAVTVNEGLTAYNSGSFADVPDDTVTLSASVGTVVKNVDGTWNWSFDTSDGPAESQLVTITATDDDGGSSTATFPLTVNNVAPTISADVTTIVVDEGSTAGNTGSFSDVAADIVSLSASFGFVIGHSDGTWSWSGTAGDGPAVQTVTITATDDDGASSTVTFGLDVHNVNPLVAVNAATVVVNEGSPAANNGTFSDVPGDTVILSATIGTVTANGDGTWSWLFNTSDGPVQSQTVTITASDEDGGSSAIAFQLTVNNVAPVLTLSPVAAVDENGTATLNLRFTDPGVLDQHTFTINWGDGSTNQVVKIPVGDRSAMF
jgi:hypothetical protein